MELKEVDLNDYFENRVDGDDVIYKYVTAYNSLDSDLERINFTANLASLKVEYGNQHKIEGQNIDGKVSKLKSQIYEYTGVPDLDLDLGELMLLPPDPVEEKDDIEDVIRGFIVGLEYFVDMLKYGPLKASFALKRLNEIEAVLSQKVDYSSIDFYNLQLIVNQSVKRTATFQHRKIIQELINRIPMDNYPEKLESFDKRDAGIKRGNDELDTNTIIENVAVSIASKGSSNYSEKSIIAYLKKSVEKPGLSRRVRKEECLFEAEDEEVKADFVESAPDATVMGWENKLDAEREKIKGYHNLA